MSVSSGWLQCHCECFRNGVVQCSLGGAAASKGAVSAFVKCGTAHASFGLVSDGQLQFALDQQREGFVV